MRKDKSLGIMSQKFLMLFLVSKVRTVKACETKQNDSIKLHIIDVLIIYFVNIINAVNHIYRISRLVHSWSSLILHCVIRLLVFLRAYALLHAFLMFVFILKRAFVPTASDSQLGSFGKNTHRRCTPRQAGKFQI